MSESQTQNQNPIQAQTHETTTPIQISQVRTFKYLKIVLKQWQEDVSVELWARSVLKAEIQYENDKIQVHYEANDRVNDNYIETIKKMEEDLVKQFNDLVEFLNEIIRSSKENNINVYITKEPAYY